MPIFSSNNDELNKFQKISNECTVSNYYSIEATLLDLHKLMDISHRVRGSLMGPRNYTEVSARFYVEVKCGAYNPTAIGSS